MLSLRFWDLQMNMRACLNFYDGIPGIENFDYKKEPQWVVSLLIQSLI